MKLSELFEGLFENPVNNQTNTKEFKRWFKDSKVVDKSGQPLRVFHGTNKDIEKFDTLLFGSRLDSDTYSGAWGRGFYFTNNAKIASQYALDNGQYTDNANVMPVFLSIQNPMILDFTKSFKLWTDDQKYFRKHTGMGENTHKITDELISKGYDGIIILDHNDNEYIVFNPNQIKSAIGNNGQYSDVGNINESISVSQYYHPIRNAFEKSIKLCLSNLPQDAFESKRSIMKEYHYRCDNKLVDYLIDVLSTELQKIDPNCDFIIKDMPNQYNAYVRYKTIYLNERHITDLSLLIVTTIDKMLSYYDKNDPLMDNMDNFYNAFFKSLLQYPKIKKLIDSMSSYIIHELVHIVQNKFSDPEYISKYNKSYTNRKINKPEFKEAVCRLLTDQDWDLYLSSVLEIPAHAHEFALDLIDNIWENSINDIHDPEIAQLILNKIKDVFNWKNLINNMRTHKLYSRFNNPNTKEYKIFKRFMKMAYQEVQSFKHQVEKRLQELQSQNINESFIISKESRKVKVYDDDLNDDVIKNIPITVFNYSDDIGGKAHGTIKDHIAGIAGMDSIPREFKYHPDSENYKRRGFFKALLKELYIHGFKTIHIGLQSSDTRNAVKKLLASGILKNPRDVGGLSVDEHPKTFDISPKILDASNDFKNK
jgi:hypothetical protein